MIEQPLIDVGAETVLALADETRFAPNGIVSRTLFRTEQMRVVLFGFAERQELSEHTSTRNALIQILSGECEFVLAGVPRTLKTGDLLFMPANLPHAVRATRGRIDDMPRPRFRGRGSDGRTVCEEQYRSSRAVRESHHGHLLM